MARKAGSRQLKRGPAPSFWPIHRKEAKWTTATSPGSHARERGFPLLLLVREILGYGATAKDAIRILANSKVHVDGVPRRDAKFPVGLMDVVKIGGTGQTFRLLPKPGRGLSLVSIEQREAEYKLCKISGKTTIRNETVQISMHDGRTLNLNRKEIQKTQNEFVVGATLQIALPSQKVLVVVPFRPGSVGLVTRGKNQGLHGKILSIASGSQARSAMAEIEVSGNRFKTPAEYVMPVGTETSIVALDR